MVVIGGEKIILRKEATCWLEILLNDQLKFIAYINEKLVKVKSTLIQVKYLCSSFGLAPSLVRRIQIVAI